MKLLLGIQPTGRIHIGNYFGVIENGLIEQNKGNEVIVLVANYHANATIDDTNSMMAELKRLGFNNIRKQEINVLEMFYSLSHTEMVKNLERLPQYSTKEKTLHMLSYPLLMACDIILSGCDGVLVGEDQMPHIYYYHDVSRYLGIEPIKGISLPERQIKSIIEPTKKMSKSLGDNHCIYIDDTLDDMKIKLKKSPTTPEGIKELKKIGNFVGFEYDEINNSKSKELLAKYLYNYFNKI